MGELEETNLQLKDELVRLRVAVGRLAQKAGAAEHIPGAPGPTASFDRLTEVAKQHDRGWHALVARLMERVGACEHCECPEAHEPKPEPESHEPGCDLFVGKDLCSCSPYKEK